jgi:hypothetical protein
VDVSFAICNREGEHLYLENVLVFVSSDDLTTLFDAPPFCIPGAGCLEHPCELPVVTGDLDCDGAVTFDDINPFVLALSNPATYEAAYPNCNIWNADCNSDGLVNFDDINPFVWILSQGG